MAGERPNPAEHQIQESSWRSRMPDFIKNVSGYAALAAVSVAAFVAPEAVTNVSSAFADGNANATTFNPNDVECQLPDQLGPNANRFGTGKFLPVPKVENDDQAADYTQGLSG